MDKSTVGAGESRGRTWFLRKCTLQSHDLGADDNRVVAERADASVVRSDRRNLGTLRGNCLRTPRCNSECAPESRNVCAVRIGQAGNESLACITSRSQGTTLRPKRRREGWRRRQPRQLSQSGLDTPVVRPDRFRLQRRRLRRGSREGGLRRTDLLLRAPDRVRSRWMDPRQRGAELRTGRVHVPHRGLEARQECGEERHFVRDRRLVADETHDQPAQTPGLRRRLQPRDPTLNLDQGLLRRPELLGLVNVE